jgi:hypothetical protein
MGDFFEHKFIEFNGIFEVVLSENLEFGEGTVLLKSNAKDLDSLLLELDTILLDEGYFGHRYWEGLNLAQMILMETFVE